MQSISTSDGFESPSSSLVNPRQACDLLYFAKKYHDQLDFHEIRNIMKEYHMDSFAMNVLDIGVCFLGFTWEELGLSKPSDSKSTMKKMFQTVAYKI